MQPKKVLLIHISQVSGHRCASLAIEKALREMEGNIQIKNINGFHYTNPLAEKVINLLYMLVIKNIPELWDYLYDNENVLRRLRKVRSVIHTVKNKKIKKLLNSFQPDMVVCTQAFPCGMIADYKSRYKLKVPLMGVLTDFAPHSYWLNDFVDIYVVPSEKIKERFGKMGIAQERLKTFGIPIDVKFSKANNRQATLDTFSLDPHIPIILIMGGGQGLGPIREIVRSLEQLSHPAQLIIVCGTNKRLYKWLKKRQSLFQKTSVVLEYTDKVDWLMDIASFIVTKPGGLTTAEALSKSLPIIIVGPLPGQESLNTNFLLESGAALKVNNPGELKNLAEQLLTRTEKLEELRKKAHSLAHANSALSIASEILETIEKQNIRYRDALFSL